MRTVFTVTVTGDLDGDDPDAEMNVHIQLVEGTNLTDGVGVFIAATHQPESGSVTFASGEVVPIPAASGRVGVPETERTT